MYRFQKKITLITLFFIISICSFSQKTFTNTINYQGIERGYIIHIPNSYTGKSAVPLILCFHGYSSSANIIMSYSGFNELSEKEGFIVVYPQGAIYKKSGKTHWNVGYTLESKIDDIEFTNILLDNLFLKYRINKDSELLNFITLLIENFYNVLSLNDSNNINNYFINKNRISYLINDMKKFNLDKKNLLISIDRILKNESQ